MTGRAYRCINCGALCHPRVCYCCDECATASKEAIRAGGSGTTLDRKKGRTTAKRGGR